jgi:hypothetical protein
MHPKKWQENFQKATDMIEKDMLRIANAQLMGTLGLGNDPSIGKASPSLASPPGRVGLAFHRGKSETEADSKVSSDTGRETQISSLTRSGFGIVRSVGCALSGVMKRFRYFGGSKHVSDALEIVCHRREADFRPCTG